MLAWLVLLNKAALYACVLGAGGLAVHDAMKVARLRRWLGAFAVLAILLTWLRLLLLNAEINGGLAEALDFNLFSWIWSANQVQVLAVCSGSVLAGLGAVTGRRSLLILAALVLAASFGLGGHTQGIEEPGIAPFVSALHVLIAGFWFMAPLVLWPGLGQSSEQIVSRMDKFSRVAMIAIPILFVGGGWLALRLAGSFIALFETSYGRLLLLKLALAMVALCLGALNKLWLTGKIRQDGEYGRRLLRRILVGDIFLFAGVLLAIAAATTFTGPPV